MDTNGHTILCEDYCSYEVAKLLKEKGFEGDINAYYHIWDNGNKVCSVQEFSHSEAPHLYIPAPTHQMAMKWLREVHNLYINIFVTWKDKIPHYQWSIDNLITQDTIYDTPCLEKYEEAVEAACLYALKNLI